MELSLSCDWWQRWHACRQPQARGTPSVASAAVGAGAALPAAAHPKVLRQGARTDACLGGLRAERVLLPALGAARAAHRAAHAQQRRAALLQVRRLLQLRALRPARRAAKLRCTGQGGRRGWARRVCSYDVDYVRPPSQPGRTLGAGGDYAMVVQPRACLSLFDESAPVELLAAAAELLEVLEPSSVADLAACADGCSVEAHALHAGGDASDMEAAKASRRAISIGLAGRGVVALLIPVIGRRC